MKLTHFALRNPLVIGAITLVLICFGLYSYFSMAIAIVPNVNFPGVEIVTTEPGADPQTVETQITKPIEDAVSALPNIDTMTSTSNEGVSTISVQFTTAANATLVPVDVERAVNQARANLPADANPPSVASFDTNSIPVLVVSLSGSQPLSQLQQVATNRLQTTLQGIAGVGSVSVNGGSSREIQVKVNMSALQARGIGLNTLQQALQAEQIEVPAGTLTSATKDVNVLLNGLVSSPAQLGQIIVAQTPTGPVYLRDVATVDDTLKQAQVIARVNGRPAVTLTVTKLASANTIQVSQAVQREMAQLQPTLPQGMKLDTVFNAADYTQQSFNTIQKTLIEAVIFTGLILLLFLHTWRSTLIVLVAIPTSVLTTFGIMNLIGFNLNLFSMLALTLAVGILVDDSIVVLENIYRHLGLKEPPYLAAINGRNEIGLAAITITMVDVVVYVPIALIPGIAGDFIRPFALVIAAATLTSLIVSFTLTPLLASRYLALEQTISAKSGRLAAVGRVWDAGFNAIEGAYQRLLAKVLSGRKGRRLVILIGVLSFVLGIGTLFTGRIGFDIFPSGDQSEVDVSVTMPSGTSLNVTDAAARQMEARLQSFREVRQVTTVVGQGSGFGASSGDTATLRVLLVPPDKRSRSSAQLADAIRPVLSAGIPGATVRTDLPSAFGFGGFGGQPIQASVRGPNPDVLNALVDKMTIAMAHVPGAVDVNNANQKTQPEEVIQMNRDQAAALGITAQQAAQALSAAVDGTVVTKFRQPGQDAVDIRLIANDAFRANPANLSSLPLLSSNGSIVSLGQIGTIVQGSAPVEIDHVNRERAVTINASVSGRTVGQVQSDIQTAIAKIPLPPGYSVTYGGQGQQGASAFSDIYKAMGVAMLLIYVLMMMLFGSVTLPLAVMMSLPLALVGAFGAMAITATPFTLFSLLGFTLLIGLVGKNAILLVDYTDTLRKRGLGRAAALLEAGPTRLRPIVMTTMSVIVALSPLALGIEQGSELLKAAAIVLIGGLITSTVLTLVFVPAMYTLFDDVQEWMLRQVRKVATARELEPAEVELVRHQAVQMITANRNGRSHGAPTPMNQHEPSEEGAITAGSSRT
ncbi:MAG TPA: efflux RND transporter permease subunit [Chloroflexota bacterium]|nr:efflux RND transporter permease subunit [Chloroflexota bacterium]